MTTLPRADDAPAAPRDAAPPADHPGGRVPRRLASWVPAVAATAAVAGILLAADTPPVDLARFAGYAVLAVALPGTLVYRALRRTPHTLVEDVAMGVAVGLALELAGWAVFSALDLRGWVWLWPAAVVAAFLVVPRLRRHWRVRGYTAVPAGWSWAVGGAVVLFTAYLAEVFLFRNPVVPASEQTQQYLDLAYQLSLAGEAKHHFPPQVPQVAGEPLHYHWFGYVHMAMTSMIGHIDLAVVSLRLAVPALCAAAIVLVAVVGWRVSGRPYVGAGAAVLMWIIGEVNFTDPVTMPFGTQVTFVIWHGISMTYSWVLLIALIAPLADIVGRAAGSRAPRIGPGSFALAAVLLLASGGAKASSLPVVVGALAFTAVILFLTTQRIPWRVVIALGMALATQLLAMAVLFAFHSYGLSVDPWGFFRRYWVDPPGRPEWMHYLVVLAVLAAFGINMQSRVAGVVPLAWWRRGRLEPVQVLVLGGALAGLAVLVVFVQSSGGGAYFVRASLPFGVLLSAWGYAIAVDRARLSRTGALALAAGTAAAAALLILIQVRYAPAATYDRPIAPLEPLLAWSGALLLAGLAGALLWFAGRSRIRALRGRGALVALTAVLVAGAPGLVMDVKKSRERPNGGAYHNISMPRSRVLAARWVRANSDPDDILATNVHCQDGGTGPRCDARSFWLSAYAERTVLVEGWSFAPRTAGNIGVPYWDPALLARNDRAFTAPTAPLLADLRDDHGVRWLVVDRAVSFEAADLRSLADLRYDNGRLAVYRLR